MANPQLENGYTKIANELYDAIIQWHFSSYEYRVLIYIIRKTYGWNKKTDWISLSQFNKATNIPIPHICRTLFLLVKQNVITKGGNRSEPLYGIQKNFELWKQLPKGVRSHHITKGGNSLLPKGVIVFKKGVDTKETITKETITKETTTAVAIGGIKDLVNMVIGLFKEVNPTYVALFKRTNQRIAAESLLKLFTFEEIQEIVAILPTTNGRNYAPTITTPLQLEDKIGQLRAYLKRNNSPKLLKYEAIN